MGPAAIADVWAAAKRAHAEIEAGAFSDPDYNLPRDGIKPGQWEGAPHGAMPPGCPVEVLGSDRHGVVWVKAASGHLRALLKWDLQTITDLFAPHINFPYWAWPAWGKDKITDENGDVKEVLRVKRIERDKLFMCLGAQAKRLPEFDPETQHRGRGGWRTDEGDYLWHSGRYLWRVHQGKLQNISPTQVGEYLYTQGRPMMEPWAGPVSQAESPALGLLRQLKTWNHARPYLDPVLLVGWLVTAFMGNATKHRPVIMVTGGYGTGKSTLQELIRRTLGGVAFESEDATAAGIYQQIQHDAIPVMVDELEHEAGTDKQRNILKLARISYTGGKVDRGGADHKGTFFRLYCPFFLSAINPPRGGDQDQSRMAKINLSKIPPSDDSDGGRFTVRDTDGPMILRQVMDGWPAFCDKLLPYWWELLASLPGIDRRSIDTLGTLLAAAELVLGQAGLEEAGLPVTDETRLAEILQASTEDERAARLDNWHKCLNHLMACSIDNWKEGRRPTVGGVLDDLARSTLEVDLGDARNKLEQVNLGIKPKGSLGDPGAGPYLAVPHDGPNLAKLFNGTPWGDAGWTDALRQEASGIVVKQLARRNDAVVKIAGFTRRCTLIDVTKFQAFCEGG